MVRRMLDATPLAMREVPTAVLPWPWLLEADPSAAHVETYLHRSTWFGLFQQGTLLGVAALLRHDARTIELMNVAVSSAFRRQGIGTRFLRRLFDEARRRGASRLQVGTGNSSLAELAFYQRAGFRFDAIEHDHFVREYPHPIVENGIVCRDRVRLAIALEPVDEPGATSRPGDSC